VSQDSYLLDTHALIFWVERSLSADFLAFLDNQNQYGRLFVSSISFWEIALLVQKGRVNIQDVHKWQDEVLSLSNIRLLDPTASEMVDSVLLPQHHNDPFDRLLIAQATAHHLSLVSRDKAMGNYAVSLFWI
jgi:PIN domain nuclease of toxin-antitoxin system